MDSKGDQNKGRVFTYELRIKHRGELSDKYLDKIKRAVWSFIGDVSMEDIKLRRVVNKQ